MQHNSTSSTATPTPTPTTTNNNNNNNNNNCRIQFCTLGPKNIFCRKLSAKICTFELHTFLNFHKVLRENLVQHVFY